MTKDELIDVEPMTEIVRKDKPSTHGKVLRVELVGVCQSKATGIRCMFQRVLIRLSSKYRVYPVPGDYRFLQLDPEEYRSRYKTIEQYRNEA